jgi:hypothetical protein
MNFQDIILNEVSHRGQNTAWLNFNGVSKINSYKKKVEQRMPWMRGGRKEELLFKVSVQQDMKFYRYTV